MRKVRSDKKKKPFKVLCFCDKGLGISQTIAHSLKESLTGEKKWDLIDENGRKFKSEKEWELVKYPYLMPKDQILPNVGLRGRDIQLSIRGIEAEGHLKDRRLTPNDLKEADYMITHPVIVNMRNRAFKRRPELHDGIERAKTENRLAFATWDDAKRIREIRRIIEKKID